MSWIVLSLLVLLAPLLSAAAIGLVFPLRRSGTGAAYVSIAAALVSLGASFALLGAEGVARVAWLPEAGKSLGELGLRIDGIAGPMLVVVGLVASMVQVFSLGYLHDEPKPALGRYYGYQSLFLFAMQTLVLSPNLLQLFVAWELVGLCSYLLIGFWFQKPSAGKAALKAFWVNKFGDMGFLLALVLLYGAFGTFDIPSMQASSTVAPAAAVGLLFLAVCSKSAQFPLHVWLPDAMEGPTPVSALLHAATMVAAGVFLLVRTSFLFAAAPDVQTVVIHVGAFTAAAAALTGLVQRDVKKVLAWSTCSQLGLMVAAIGAGGVLAGYYHLFTHAFFKALLFLAAGSLIHGTGTQDLREMGGVGRRMPWTMALFGIGALALAGIPPFSGFFSKELILGALEEHPVALGLALLTTALTPFYVGHAFFLAFLGAPRSHGSEHAHESSALLRGPMLVLAVPALAAGGLASWFAGGLGTTYELHIGPLGLLAVALAVSGLTAAWLAHGRQPRIDAIPEGLVTALSASPLDRAYEILYGRALLVLAGAIGWFDRYVVDGVVNLFGWAGLEGGARLRRVQTGLVHQYVLAILVAAVVFAAWGIVGG